MTFGESKDINSPYRFRGEPLYIYDLDSPKVEKTLLDWVKAQYKVDKEELNSFYMNKEENIAMFLGRGKSMSTVARLTETNILYPRKRSYIRLEVNQLKSIIENLTGQFVANKINMYVTPRHITDFTLEAKSKTSKKLIDTIFAERNVEHLKRRMIQDALSKGESFVRVFWDENLGDLKKKKKVKRDITPDAEVEVEETDEVEIQERQGDVNFELLDSRFVFMQPANSYEESEWVGVVDFFMPEKLKIMYEDKREKLEPASDNDEYFNTTTYEMESRRGYVRRYRIWHRACREMPEGRYIECTDSVVLKNEKFEDKRLIEDQLFPVVNLYDYDLFGTPRGNAITIMEPGKPLQLALHNLWSMFLRNIASFPPKFVWPAGVDKKQVLNGSASNVFIEGKMDIPPQLLAADPVSASLVNGIDRLSDALSQLGSISPVLMGRGMANTEVRSGRMLDIFREEDKTSRISFKDKLDEAFIKIAKLVLAIAADRYKNAEGRLVKIFGRRNRFMKTDFSIEDIQIPVDIQITRGSAFPASQEGKVALLEKLMSLAPGDPATGQKPLVSRERMIDLFELAEPEAFYDDVTGSIDTAERDIERILQGEKVSPPNAQLELMTYYETLLRSTRHPSLKDMIPQDDEFEKKYLSENQPKDAGFRIKKQILETEMLLFESAEDNPILKQKLQIDFPYFPTVYVPEPQFTVDPREIEQEPGIPMTPDELGMSQGQPPPGDPTTQGQ